MQTNNTKLKREAVKYIRDKAKSAYVKDVHCYVCNVESPLDLHHVYSISELFSTWCLKSGIVVNSVEDILGVRERFISEHKKELYIDVRTLCKKHHKYLHSLFGQHPSLKTAQKQLVFLEKLKLKLGN